MLLIQSHVELLQVAYAGANVGNLIDGDGFAEGSASSQQKHQSEQQQRQHGNTGANAHRNPYSS